MYEAPTIRMAYPGSAELRLLWADLEAIGWTVPEQPLVPYQASAWVGTRGRNNEHEYRVEDFEIIPGDWPLHEVADRGIETINLLRRMGVDVRMPISYLDFLRKTQLEQKANPHLPAAAHRPVAVPDSRIPNNTLPVRPVDNDVEGPLMVRPRLAVVPDPSEDSEQAEQEPVPAGQVIVDMPQAILLSNKAWSVLQTEPGLEMYQSVVVPGRTRWVWSETCSSVSNLGSTLPDPRILFETVELGWQRAAEHGPTMMLDPTTQRVLWFIVHQLGEANSLVSFLHEQPGVLARAVPMSPMPRTTAFDDCFLVGAVVPASDFATIGSKVVSNHPDVIARGKPSPLADTATTFSR